VHPVHQGEGLGAVLISNGLSAAALAGWERVLLVGDASYYGRFGFDRLRDVRMPDPINPERVLGQALTAASWKGVTGRVTPWKDPPH